MYRVKGEPNEFILSHDQNFISIEFSALDFSIPKENKYSYILQGFQNTWIFTGGSNRTATYTNLPSGEFTFLVKGTNEDGIWNETPASIRIIIKSTVLANMVVYHFSDISNYIFYLFLWNHKSKEST